MRKQWPNALCNTSRNMQKFIIREKNPPEDRNSLLSQKVRHTEGMYTRSTTFGRRTKRGPNKKGPEQKGRRTKSAQNKKGQNKKATEQKDAEQKGRRTKRTQNKKDAEQKGRRTKRTQNKKDAEQKGRRTKRAQNKKGTEQKGRGDHDVASPLHSRS